MRLLFLMASLLLGSAPAHATAFWTFNVRVNAVGESRPNPPLLPIASPFSAFLNFNVILPEFTTLGDLDNRLLGSGVDPTGLGSTQKFPPILGKLDFANGTITGRNFYYSGGPGDGSLACQGCLVYTLSAPAFSVAFVSSDGGPGPVPEPATWAMMLTGFGMVGWALRRARQQAKVRYGFA